MPGYQLHKPIWQMSKNWFQSSSICQNSLQIRISLTLAPNRMERSLVMWCCLLGPRMIHENLSGFTGRFAFSFWLKTYIYLNPVLFMLVNNIVLILRLVAPAFFLFFKNLTCVTLNTMLALFVPGPRVWLCQCTPSWVDWFDIREQTTRTSGHWSKQCLLALLLWGQSQYLL